MYDKAQAQARPDPAELDRQWLATVYQGDRVPQLTLRAVLVGGVLGMLLSISNVYMVMKVGWSFGVAITACVLSFTGWGAVRVLSGGRISQLSILENNCMQSTASSAAFGTASGLAVTFGALLILDPAHRHQPWWAVTMFTGATGLMGVFLAVPAKRQLINWEQLPFPSGTATAATLRSLYSNGLEAMRKARALVAALFVGVLTGISTTAEDQFAALGRFFEWMRTRLFEVHLPDQWPAQGFAPIGGKPAIGLDFEPGVLMIGAGMLMGLRVTLSMLGASLMLYFVVAPWLQGIDAQSAGVTGYVASIPSAGAGKFYHPLRWALWGGVSVLVFSSLTILALQWRTIARAFPSLRRRSSGDPLAGDTESAMAALEVPRSWLTIGLVPICIAMLFVQIVAFGVAWWVGVIAIAMSTVLVFVAARSTGESDINPLGPMGKVMQLLFAVIAPAATNGVQASVTQNVMSAGIAANTASSGGELLTDLKSGYLLGANPRRQFLAQCAGVLFGCLAAVPGWYLMVPNIDALEKYPLPATQIWVAVARALTQGLSYLPMSAKLAILVGACVGVALPLIEKLFPRAAGYLPSVTGLGLGWVVFFSNTLSMAIGAVIAALWGRYWAKSRDTYCVPIASGLIAGESMVKALLAMLATALGLAGGG